VTPGVVLLTGASGYVGSRLRAALEARGVRLRCMAREPRLLAPRVAPATEVVRGDVLDPASLGPALHDVATAYYLIHSMASGRAFEEHDRAAARNFGAAARAAGVRRIIYLGGLGHGPGLSAHLESRQETGRLLRESGVPVIELRASVIIGSGSASFELVRGLVDRLPVMTTPRWVSTEAQPIAIEDVIEYLVQALVLPGDESRIYEIGGADRSSYRDLMREYAERRGLKRWLIRLPFLTPRLSSLWLRFVTPLYASVGRELIEGVRNPSVVEDPSALRDFPLKPRGMREAITRALANEDAEMAATRWNDVPASQGSSPSWGGARFGSRLVDSRSLRVDAAPAAAFAAIRSIGGRNGWYHAGWLWRVRGWLDLLAGGPGMRRGRRDPEQLLPGDALDWWRVETIEPDRLLRLVAEMRLPGRAWLQYEIEPCAEGGAVIRQTALFDPVGLLGLAYWYALWPVHQYVFSGLLSQIARRAEATGTKR
jgi:uncharacterized protein YbjT (DUF2867 family)